MSGGIKRLVFNLANDTLTADQQTIATTAGLTGDNPTAVALGPDGNVYVGFLKNGDVKRIRPCNRSAARPLAARCAPWRLLARISTSPAATVCR